MAPETVDREKLKDELDDDAMNAYDEREEQLGEELMRYLERSILLQVIDNRWREHLFDMDYLREGIHLRGFAQIDPLVAYKNEGFSMFEELMHSIWEEFSKLIFHAEVEIDPAQAAGRLRRQRRRRAGPRSTTPAARSKAQPSALQQVGRRRRRRRGRRRRGRRRGRRSATAPPEVVETVVKDEHDKIGRNDPCWCGSRQEVQEVPRRLSGALDAPIPSGSSSAPSTSATSTRSSRSSTPRSSCTRCGGCARGVEAARLWATRAPGGRAADDRARGALRGRDRGRRRLARWR